MSKYSYVFYVNMSPFVVFLSLCRPLSCFYQAKCEVVVYICNGADIRLKALPQLPGFPAYQVWTLSMAAIVSPGIEGGAMAGFLFSSPDQS